MINNLQILLIEDCCNDLLNEREIYWIDYYKSSCDLTNGTIAAEALGFTRGNITNAIRFKRQIGK